MNRNDVYKLIPEHDLLTDQSLKEKCADIWIEVLEMGKWEEKGLNKCPIAIKVIRDDCPEDCIAHTRQVTQMCAAAHEALIPLFNKIGPCDRGLLIAGALIHDVGKFLEYDIKDGVACYSEQGLMFRHPCTGAYLAQKYGLPSKIVHMVLTHSLALSPEGPNAFNTPESLVLKYIDELCYNYVKIHFGI
jgi:putative nucleotidyltransferase with HDIG domain